MRVGPQLDVPVRRARHHAALRRGRHVRDGLPSAVQPQLGRLVRFRVKVRVRARDRDRVRVRVRVRVSASDARAASAGDISPSAAAAAAAAEAAALAAFLSRLAGSSSGLSSPG